MNDAFGNELNVGDEVIAIATLHSTQTLYRGTVVGFSGLECARVEVDELSSVDTGWSRLTVFEPGMEKRICVSHRLAKVCP
jgi:hypothetical protein